MVEILEHVSWKPQILVKCRPTIAEYETENGRKTTKDIRKRRSSSEFGANTLCSKKNLIELTNR